MGEIADGMVNGLTCEGCGEFFEESLGYPGKCERCLRAEGDWDEALGSSRRVVGDAPWRTKEDREANRRLALHHFDEAKQLALSKGLVLKRFNDQHYQLTNGEWLQNIYPGNQRLWHDRNHKKPGFLQLPSPWTLLDVVSASPAKPKGSV